MPIRLRQAIASICMIAGGGAFLTLATDSTIAQYGWLGLIPIVIGGIVIGINVKDNIPMLNH